MVNAYYGIYGSPSWGIYCETGRRGGLHYQESYNIPTINSGTYLEKKNTKIFMLLKRNWNELLRKKK